MGDRHARARVIPDEKELLFLLCLSDEACWFFFSTRLPGCARPLGSPGRLCGFPRPPGQKGSVSQSDRDSNPALGPRRDYKHHRQNAGAEATVSQGRRGAMSQRQRDAAAGRWEGFRDQSWAVRPGGFQHLNKQRLKSSNTH